MDSAKTAPPAHQPPQPRLAQWALGFSIISILGLPLSLELGWLGLPGLALALIYLLAPVTERGPGRLARLAATLSCVALMTAGVHFTLNHAIPGILAGGQKASARTAVSTLRTLYWAQETFQAALHVDQDGDSIGEYGTLAELAGLAPLRNGRPALSPAIFAHPITHHEDAQVAYATLGPYHYALFLPTQHGATSVIGRGSDGVDADLSERAWVAYAWPTRLGATGSTVFFINSREEVLESDNQAAGQRYSGDGPMPRWDAALSSSSLDAPLVVGQAQDGGRWTRWKNKQPRERSTK